MEPGILETVSKKVLSTLNAIPLPVLLVVAVLILVGVVIAFWTYSDWQKEKRPNYRIIPSGGYYVVYARRWFWPIWMQCWAKDGKGYNLHRTIKEARFFAVNHAQGEARCIFNRTAGEETKLTGQ